MCTSIRRGLLGLLFVLLCFCRVGWTEVQQAEPAAASAEEVLQRVTKFYAELKSYSVEIDYKLSGEAPAAQAAAYRETRRVVVARPNRFAIAPLKEKSPVAASDGKEFFVLNSANNQYVIKPAEKAIDSYLAQRESLFMGSGRLALQFASSDPLGQLAGANASLQLLDAKDVKGAACHRIEATQQRVKVIVWVQKSKKPLIRKIEWKLQVPAAAKAQPGVVIPMPVATFENWAVDQAMPKETFSAQPPEGAKQVESLFQPPRPRQVATRPIPNGPDALTAQDVKAARLDYNRRTLVDAYQQHGKHDPSWDSEAEDFLSEMATYFTRAEGFKTPEEMLAMGESLLSAGCDDPMVKYCCAATLGKSKKAQAKALRLSKESYPDLVDLGYPANRRYAAAWRVWSALKKDKSKAKEAHKYFAFMEQEAQAIVLQDDLSDFRGRELIGLVFELMEELSVEGKAKFYESVKEHEPQQPFMVNMVGGLWHMDAAWKSRGSGWASDVTEEGWKGFYEHVKLSHECYERAWEAAPTRPEAATRLISVAMAQGNSPAAEMRQWFDRAVEAQIDYPLAYSKMRYGLKPRWHGSFGKMYEFGVECMKTERYDTDVPFQLCKVLWSIGSDSQNSLGLNSLKRPGVYEKVSEVCRRYIEHHENTATPDTNMITWWKGVWMGFAYCNESWEEAASILDELNEEIDPDALERFPLQRDIVVREIRMHTAPNADSILEALELSRQGDRPTAIERLSKVAGEKLHPLVAKTVRSRLQGLKWREAFETGEAVDLTPSKELAGWVVKSGEWSITKKGAVQGVSDKDGVVLATEADFGHAWELSGELHYGRSPYDPWDAGVVICLEGKPAFSVMYNPSKDWVAAGPYKQHKQNMAPHKREGKPVSFRLRQKHGVIDLWLDDELAIEQQELDGWKAGAAIQVGVGASYNWKGSTLRFKNLTIKRVD